MKKLNINGREVLTNYERFADYPIDHRSYAHKNATLCLRKNHCESDEEMLERLVERGFTRITFYETTTRVKGYHDLIAYASKKPLREEKPKFETIRDDDGDVRGYKLGDRYLMKIYTWGNTYYWVVNKDGRRHYSQVEFSNAIASGEVEIVESCKAGKQRLIELNKKGAIK